MSFEGWKKYVWKGDLSYDQKMFDWCTANCKGTFKPGGSSGHNQGFRYFSIFFELAEDCLNFEKQTFGFEYEVDMNTIIDI